MKRRSAIDNLRPWAAWMVRRRMWLLVFMFGAVVGVVAVALASAWAMLRTVFTADAFREAWADLRQAAREAAAERAGGAA